MKNKLFITSILTVIALFIFSIPTEAFTKKDSLSLKYNLNSGQEFKVAYLMTNFIQTEAMGYSVSLNQDMNIYYTTTVAQDTVDIYLLTTRIDRIIGHQKMMGMESTYDSQIATEPTDQMGKELKRVMDALIGKVITMKINDKGEVIQSNYQETFGEASSGGMSMFDNSQSWYPVFSTKKVMPGSTWEHSIKLGDDEFAFNSITTYTLQSVNKKRAVLQISTVYEPIEGTKLNGVSGTTTGTMEIDLKTGFPVESETNQHMELTLEEQGMKVPLKIDADVTMKILK